jgi:hypothetical protein
MLLRHRRGADFTYNEINNMERIIGRETEYAMFDSYMASGKNEFVALYGRRRVGKTFLVRSYFNDTFDFYATGVIEGSRATQMASFYSSLLRYGYTGDEPKTWVQAFDALAGLLESKQTDSEQRLVVFLDELPCFDTPRAGFLAALDLFWNSRASWFRNICFVVCGSATSWMMRKIVNNRGGLHNRATHIVHLRPFTLGQTEEYLQSRKFHWPRIAVLQAYMALGGVPYYLSLLNPKKNLPDNLDSLFFSASPMLENEYQRLFKSLFRSADAYMEIIRLLSTRRDGFTRAEIAKTLKITDNGHLCNMLDDLEHCDFVRRYNNGRLQKNGIYQLVDFFSLFHYRFCTRRVTDEHFWRNSLGTPEQNSWYGLTFERVCLWHVSQIVHALHLDTIRHEYYAWRSRESTPAVQIDLVIDRADGIATICEIKYSKDDYLLTEKEYRNIVRREETFRTETAHKGGVQVCLITTYGLRNNTYSDISSSTLSVDALFDR